MNNKQKKFCNIDWEAAILYTMLTAGIMLLGGATVYADLNKRHALYKPGQSLSRTERAMVDSLHDHDLEKHKKKYETYRQDYLRELKKCPVYGWANEKLGHGHRMPYLQCAEPTVGEYHEFLKNYEQKVIERKYQELNAQLQKQK